MKKIWIYAMAAMVAFVSCNKEANTPVDNEPNLEGKTLIKAIAAAETRTTIDGLDVKWAANDKIAVFAEDGVAYPFELVSGEGSTEGTFSGNAPTAVGYAVYPYTTNASLNTATLMVTVDYPSTYKYAEVTVPMFGEEDSTNPGQYAFSHIGGAFKISYTNVPEGATKFVFTSTDNNIAGSATYDPAEGNTSIATGTKVVTVTDLPTSSTLDFIIPVPAGTYTFNVKILDASDNILGASEKAVTSAKSVLAGHVKPLKAIKLRADLNETLWSEDFAGCSAGEQPNQSTTAVYGGGNASYAYNGEYTKVFVPDANNSSLMGSEELLIAKLTRNETWTVSGIPTGAWTSLALSYRANQSLSITSSVATIEDFSYAEITDKYGTYTKKITVPAGTESFTLVFSMQTDYNARIDDIVLTAGAPVAPHSITINPEGDIVLGGDSGSAKTISVISAYPWTASFSNPSGRGTGYDIYLGEQKIEGTVSGQAGTTSLTFIALNDGNSDGVTVTDFGTITFTDDESSTTTSGAISIKQTPKGISVVLSENFSTLETWSSSTFTSLELPSGTWTASGSVYTQVGCIKLGKSSGAANTISLPALSLSKTTNVKISFKAVSSVSAYPLTVSATNAGSVSGTATVYKHGSGINSGASTATELANAFAAAPVQTVKIANATSSTVITIKTTSNSKQWYIDDVVVEVDYE